MREMPIILLLLLVLLPSAAMSWPLKGIIPPLVTPMMLGSNEEIMIDQEATERVIHHVVDGGVSGIFILGTTGEFASLSRRLKHEFVHCCCQAVAQRVPVLVGVADCSFEETVELAKTAQRCGADAIVLTTPYYFPLTQDELYAYVMRVLDQTTLPVMLYNMPGLTQVWFELETLEKLAHNPRIVGVKDSSGDLEYFAKVCKLKEQKRRDWTIMMGPEHLTLKAIRLGADGGVNGGANVLPNLFVNLCKNAVTGGEECNALQRQVEAFQAIYSVSSDATAFPYVSATKCAMSIKGLCRSDVAPPLRPVDQQDRDRIQTVLDRIESGL